MGMDYAPLLSDLFSCCYNVEFILKLLYEMAHITNICIMNPVGNTGQEMEQIEASYLPEMGPGA
jgi:hypothetical protein